MTLPSGWTEARLDEIAAPEPRSITDGPFGSALKTSDYAPSGARVIRLGNEMASLFLTTLSLYP
jgi:type I restriction enzyme S subunit